MLEPFLAAVVVAFVVVAGVVVVPAAAVVAFTICRKTEHKSNQRQWRIQTLS